MQFCDKLHALMQIRRLNSRSKKVAEYRSRKKKPVSAKKLALQVSYRRLK